MDSTALNISISRKKPSDLSRVAALSVSHIILVQSLGKYTRECIRQSCLNLTRQGTFATNGAYDLTPFIQALAKNTNQFINELEHSLMKWLMGRAEHPMTKTKSNEWTVMDTDSADLEVLKGRMENQIREFVRFESASFVQRWKRVQAEKFNPDSGVISPLEQGMFIVEFIRNKELPKELTDELLVNFSEGFPDECRSILNELNNAFQAMGLKPGGWEVFNGKEQKCPSEV